MNLLLLAIGFTFTLSFTSGYETICGCVPACPGSCVRCKDQNKQTYHSCYACKGKDTPGFDHNCKAGCSKCLFCRKDNPTENDDRFLGCGKCPAGSSPAPGEFDKGFCPPGVTFPGRR